MKKSSFLHGSLLLILINFVIRFIGFSYDVMLSKLIGAEGIGLYQMTMPVLMIFLIITTAGIPTAVSKLISEQSSRNNYDAIKKIFRISLLFTMILSTTLGIILLLLSKHISLQVFKNQDLLFCLYLLTPAIIIISLTSVIRGYYYGLKMMSTASISEIIENTSRFAIVLGLFVLLNPSKPIHGAIIAICGISIGEIFDLLWLILIQRRLIKKIPYTLSNPVSKGSIISKIIGISAPLTLTGFFNVTLQFINAILIPNKLMALGYGSSHATATYGRIMGMAMPLIYLPYIVTSALVINIIPNLSQEMTLKNYGNAKKYVILAIKITLLVALPLTMIYIFFSDSIALFLYRDINASKFIHYMGYSTVFLAMMHTFSGILYGLGKQINLTVHRIIGMVTQLLIVYFFVDNPIFGINGFFIGFFACMLIICILDSLVLWRSLRINISLQDLFIVPLLATSLMGVLISISYKLQGGIDIHDAFPFLLSIVVGLLFYLFILYIVPAKRG